MTYQDSEVTVFAAHARIRKILGPATKHECFDCGEKATEWEHPKGYGRNWNIVEPVCRPCHRKRELRRGKKVFRKNIGPMLENHRFLTFKAIYLGYKGK